MTAAVHSKSTTIKTGLNVIGEVTNIGGLAIDSDMVDVTTLAQADGYKEFIQGFRDGGECQISGNMYPGDTLGQAVLLTDFNAGTLGSYTITFPTSMGATWTFSALVKSFKGGDADTGGALKFEAVLKISGKPTLNITASGGLTALTLTGAGGALSPAFGTALRSYTFIGVTAASVTVTPTAASHTIKLYIDDVYIESVTSGVASSSIALTIAVSKRVTLVVNEVGKTEITYNIILNKVS
jgi:hypothetical protein